MGADGYMVVVLCVIRSVRPSVCLSLCLSDQNGVPALILWGFQLSAWNLVWLCIVAWSRLPQKWPCSVIFGAFNGSMKFSLTSLDEVQGKITHIRKCEEITAWSFMPWCNLPLSSLWSEIGHAQPIFVFSDRGQPRVPSFSTRLVILTHGRLGVWVMPKL